MLICNTDGYLCTNLDIIISPCVGVVSVSLAVGMALNAAGEQGEPLLRVVHAIYAVVEKLMMAMFWQVLSKIIDIWCYPIIHH